MESTDLCFGCFAAPRPRGGRCPQCGYDPSLPRPLTALPAGLVLNRQYIIGRVLGHPGGFGITYLAFDQRLHKCIAIKEYLPRDLATRAADSTRVQPYSTQDGDLYRYGLQQFEQEARTLAKLDHPNIVRVTQFFEAHGSAYLVMDYYSGETLAEYLNRQPNGRMAEPAALNLIAPVLDGLRAVHAKGLIHRDIKPANLYLARTNSGGVRPILIDFGAARQAVGERSRSLSVILSPGYAPFEQYSRKGNQGAWTDVYAAAAVLYRCLTGETISEANDRLLNDDLQLPHPLIATPRLTTALRDALALLPQDRTPSIDAFHQQLRDPSAPQQKPPSKLETPPKPPRPRPWLLIGLGVTALSALAGVVAWALLHGVIPLPSGEPSQAATQDAEAFAQAQAQAQARQQDDAAFTRAKSLGTKDGYRAYLKACQDWGCAHQAKALAALEQLDSPPGQPQPAQPQPEQREEQTAETLQPGDVFRDSLRDGGEGPEMVVIPAGSFTMGSNQGADDEKPPHRVTISRAFALGKTEVTFADYDRFCAATGRAKPDDEGWGRGTRPVINVTWEDATAYAQWLSEQTGAEYRLPTEAEWEYAARAGTDTKYWWGDRASHDHANYGKDDCCGGLAQGADRWEFTAPVGSFAANPFGLYDTAGNVWEWVFDWYDSDAYASHAATDPVVKQGGSIRVLRGGSWYSAPPNLRSAYRYYFSPGSSYVYLGFRLARTL